MRTHACNGCHDTHCTCEPDQLSSDIVKAGLDRLAEIDESIAKLVREASVLLGEVQEACKHPREEVIEGYNRSEDSNTAPFRVCKICGYNEPGWNCGYLLLGDYEGKVRRQILTVSWDTAFRHVRGGLMTQEEKIRRMNLRKPELERNLNDPESKKFWDELGRQVENVTKAKLG